MHCAHCARAVSSTSMMLRNGPPRHHLEQAVPSAGLQGRATPRNNPQKDMKSWTTAVIWSQEIISAGCMSATPRYIWCMPPGSACCSNSRAAKGGQLISTWYLACGKEYDKRQHASSSILNSSSLLRQGITSTAARTAKSSMTVPSK